MYFYHLHVYVFMYKDEIVRNDLIKKQYNTIQW